jgi:hypothetical protein
MVNQTWDVTGIKEFVVAAWMLANGADTDVKDFARRTPRELAEQRGDKALVELLEQAARGAA